MRLCNSASRMQIYTQHTSACICIHVGLCIDMYTQLHTIYSVISHIILNQKFYLNQKMNTGRVKNITRRQALCRNGRHRFWRHPTNYTMWAPILFGSLTHPMLLTAPVCKGRGGGGRGRGMVIVHCRSAVWGWSAVRGMELGDLMWLDAGQ